MESPEGGGRSNGGVEGGIKVLRVRKKKDGRGWGGEVVVYDVKGDRERVKFCLEGRGGWKGSGKAKGVGQGRGGKNNTRASMGRGARTI